jgi:hypothetical protein
MSNPRMALAAVTSGDALGRDGRPGRRARQETPSLVTAGIAPQLRALAVPLSSIELHPRNPQQGNVESVAASLRRFVQQKRADRGALDFWHQSCSVQIEHMFVAAKTEGQR